MRCWICGGNADSREHRIKASDLRRVFGPVSLENPVFHRTPDKRRIPVGSIKSKRLQFEAKICNDCNSRRTQPHDIAWEGLSHYLGTNIISIARNRRFDLSRVFPGGTKKSAIEVQLYFAKIFGCLIVEHNIPIDLRTFSTAIITESAHPHLYLSFILRPEAANRKDAAITPIQAVMRNDVPVFASWYYRLGGLIVDVVYSIDSEFMNIVKNYFHPHISKKLVRLGSFKTNRYSQLS